MKPRPGEGVPPGVARGFCRDLGCGGTQGEWPRISVHERWEGRKDPGVDRWFLHGGLGNVFLFLFILAVFVRVVVRLDFWGSVDVSLIWCVCYLFLSPFPCLGFGGLRIWR